VWRGLSKLELEGEHNGHRGFYQVQAAVRRNTLHHVLGCILVVYIGCRWKLDYFGRVDASS
jgi:hypothetical protein